MRFAPPILWWGCLWQKYFLTALQACSNGQLFDMVPVQMPRTATAQDPSRSLHRAQPGSRRRIPCTLHYNLHSARSDAKLSRYGHVSSSRDHPKRCCRAASVAAWTSTPLAWLKSQVSKEMGAHITSCLCSCVAFFVCLLLPAMMGVMICIWRFNRREDRRHTAQEQRRKEGVEWIRSKVRRAVVLAQDISKMRLADSRWSANDAARDRKLALQHARSLACTASRAARSDRHINGRMLSASFREFAPNNWHLKAAGNTAYKSVIQRPQDQPTASATCTREPREPGPEAARGRASGCPAVVYLGWNDSRRVGF